MGTLDGGWAGERGDVVLGWLTRIVIVLSLLGVIGFDAISVAVAAMTAQDDAAQAAQLASEAYKARGGTVQKAYDAAEAFAEGNGETVAAQSFVVDPGGTVHLTLEKTATTLVLRYTPWKHGADVHQSSSGTYLGS